MLIYESRRVLVFYCLGAGATRWGMFIGREIEIINLKRLQGKMSKSAERHFVQDHWKEDPILSLLTCLIYVIETIRGV
jgi:hypothetical protein